MGPFRGTWPRPPQLCAFAAAALVGTVGAAADSESMATFLSWCTDSGVKIKGVEFAATESGERGTVATRPLAKGEAVITIPLTTVINVEHALNADGLQHLWDEVADDLGDIDLTAIYLSKMRSAGSSGLAPYLNILPQEFLTNPLFYTELDVASLDGLLSESSIHKRILDTRAAFDKARAAARKVSPELLTSLTWDNFRWASVVLRSRSHMISLKDGQGEWQRAMCLVPGADMINMALADYSANVKCATDASLGTDLHKQRFVCRTTKAVAAGDELLTVYLTDPARRISSNLLLDYGFTPENNPNDAVVVDAPDIPDRDTASTKLAILKLETLRVLGRRGRKSHRDTVPKQLLIAANRWPREKIRFFSEYFFFFRVLLLKKGTTASSETIALAAESIERSDRYFDEASAAALALKHIESIRSMFAEARIACELSSYTYGEGEAATHIDRLSMSESVVLESAKDFLKEYLDSAKK